MVVSNFFSNKDNIKNDDAASCVLPELEDDEVGEWFHWKEWEDKEFVWEFEAGKAGGKITEMGYSLAESPRIVQFFRLFLFFSYSGGEEDILTSAYLRRWGTETKYKSF